MQKRNVFDSPRLLELKNKRRRNFQNKILFFVIIFILILVGLSYLTRIDRLKIKEIKISGNSVIETGEIEKIINEELSGNYFWIFPKSDILLYPKNTLEKTLKDTLKRIKDVNLSIDRQTLLANIVEREPLATWCGDTFDPTTVNENTNSTDTEIEKCYFIDKDGYLFAEAPYFSSGVYVKYYGQIQKRESVIGSTFEADLFPRLFALKGTLVSLGLKPVVFYKKENGDTYIYLASKQRNNPGPELRIKNESDFDKVAENLGASLSTEPLKTEIKNKYSLLLYIDLRFGNKVYYKFQ